MPYLSTGPSYSSGVARGFGDDIALRPAGDPYACSINLSTSTTVSTQGDGGLDVNSPGSYNYLPRNYSGLGSSQQAVCAPYVGTQGVSGNDPFLGLFPSVVDGALRLNQKFFSSSPASNVAPRSDLPGLYHVPHTGMIDVFKGRDIISGTGPLIGRRLMALQSVSTYSSATGSGHGISFIDLTGPWR